MKSSRSSAKIFSESTNEARRANQVRIVSTIEEDREQADDLVHVPRRRAVLHGLDERAEERRSREAGSRGGRVQADHAEQRPPVAAPQPARLRAQLVAGRDRKQLVHRSSPRVTVQR